MSTRSASIVPLLACVLLLATCTENSGPRPAESSSTRKAAPLDSAGLADKLGFDSALSALAANAPAELDSIRQLFAFDVHTKLGRLGYAAGPFDTELVSIRKLVT